MNRSSFNYHLPKELIAQRPAVPRDASKLMCLDKQSGEITERVFRNIVDILRPEDLLVVNDSRVIPARLLGEKEGTGANIELLILKDMGDDRWECLAKPGKRLHTGTSVVFGGGELHGIIAEELEDGNRIVQFNYNKSETFFSIIDRVGVMPLPHYINTPLKSNDDYQTVYADIDGSAAAPSAGLHFTDELIESIKQKGTGIAKITLHVGLGTFRPVKEDDITKHLMHSEYYSIPQATAEAIAKTKKRGGRVIAVGTTTCRTLEATAQKHDKIIACSASTDIFIYPGYKFKIVDALVTNFHLPESTLIMLVSAFAGYESTMLAYKKAVEGKYRFFSFGDAMIIY